MGKLYSSASVKNKLVHVKFILTIEIRHYSTLKLNKDDLVFVSEFPCLLGHPVVA